MRQPLAPIPDDPTRHILGGWNLGAVPDAGDLMGDSFIAPRAVPSRGSSGLTDRHAPFHDFRIDASTPGLVDSLLSLNSPGPVPVATRPAGDRPEGSRAGSRRGAVA
ncbi:MAG: hypothetical protein LC745_05500, partial [Planctomycetia bacterium]|nr:hypothetical protein [Planctomycetia bacterium]